MAVLKKTDILSGIDDPRKVLIESLGGEIYLRPLSSNEMNKVVDIEAEGYGTFDAKAKGRDADAAAKMNLVKMNKATAKAKYEAINISINNDKNEEWTMEEIQQLHSDQVDELYEKIMEISGASTTEKDVKRFPEDEWRPKHHNPWLLRLPLGNEAKWLDT